MPVTIEIMDGPSAAPWLSNNVLPGTLSGNGFSPASNQLSRNSTYDFKVTVANRGNEATLQPTTSGPTGAFVTASALAASSSFGTAEEDNNAGFWQIYLKNIAGNPIYTSISLASSANPANPIPHIFGFSPDGRYFVLMTMALANVIDVQVISMTTVPFGTSTRPAGTLIAVKNISPGGGTTTLASLGLGFVPTRSMLFLTWSSPGSTDFEIVDLTTPQQVHHTQVSPAQSGQVRISPSGDVLAVIGQPQPPSDAILLYKIPSLSLLPWTLNGMPVAQQTVQGSVTLTAVKSSGFGAIRVQSGSQTQMIDSPTPSLPAVAVHLWVDTSNSVFDATTAKQYPGGMVSAAQPPSGFIDRIGANQSVACLIDANWRASLPPAGQHFCAIAEAFTTPGTTPADPRQRSGTTLDAGAQRQIAQRNLVVV